MEEAAHRHSHVAEHAVAAGLVVHRVMSGRADEGESIGQATANHLMGQMSKTSGSEASTIPGVLVCVCVVAMANEANE